MVLCFYLNINWEEIIKWHLNSSLTVFLNTIKHRFLHWLWEFANFIKRSSFYKFIYRNLELSIVKHTPIECEGWRRHSSLIFLILLFTNPNIEVSGWLYQTKTHFTDIVYQPFSTYTCKRSVLVEKYSNILWLFFSNHNWEGFLDVAWVISKGG